MTMKTISLPSTPVNIPNDETTFVGLFGDELGRASIIEINKRVLDTLADPSGSSKIGYKNDKGTNNRTINNKLDEVISVKDYNAAGDGYTDDTAAIQSALDALEAMGGGALYFPRGTYMVQAIEANYLWLTNSSNRKNYAALLVPSNVLLFGDGYLSEIKLIDTLVSDGTTDGRGDYATTHIMINKGAIGLPKTIVDSNIFIENLKFNGNQIQQSGEGVSLCGVQGFSVTNCIFTGSYYETNYFVFSRGGDYSGNICYRNGLYQIDGGGPMVDSSSDINIHDNIIMDSGYYAILLINALNSKAFNNKIFPDVYSYASGYQAIRVSGCTLCTVSNNHILDSGYSAIWDHNGFSNTISDNTIVHAGYASGGGSNIHGITVDSITGQVAGPIIKGNKVFDCNGAGIAVLNTFPYGSSVQENSGATVDNNTCMFNQRDGIAISGASHRIVNNTVQSNGLGITDGVVGNGYNGISLNGVTNSIVMGNSASDFVQSNAVPLNIDAFNDTDKNPSRSVTHTEKTQNYGIVEYPTDLREEAPDSASRVGTLVTVTKENHTVADGSIVHLYNGAPSNYNGYFVATVVDTNTFTIEMVGNPNTIASIAVNGSYMEITTNDPLYLGIGESWDCFIPDGGAAGDWFAIVTGVNTANLVNMPLDLDVTGSTTCNFVQFGAGNVPDTMFVYAAESVASNNNIIRNNVITYNLSNPTLGGNGYHAYSRQSMVCGTNSTVDSNIE